MIGPLARPFLGCVLVPADRMRVALQIDLTDKSEMFKGSGYLP